MAEYLVFVNKLKFGLTFNYLNFTNLYGFRA